jgi:hypothetical protein
MNLRQYSRHNQFQSTHRASKDETRYVGVCSCYVETIGVTAGLNNSLVNCSKYVFHSRIFCFRLTMQRAQGIYREDQKARSCKQNSMLSVCPENPTKTEC